LRGAAGEPWVRAFAVLLLTQAVSEFAFQFSLPFLPLFFLDLGVPDPVQAGLWAGAMAGTFAIAQATMGPIWGVLADRYGRRMMIQRALFGGCLVIGAMTFVQTPEQLLVLRVIQGALTGVVAAMAVVVSLTVPRAHLATALGLMQAAQLIGASLGPIVGGAFADSYGLRAGFAATSMIFVVTGVLVTLFVAEPAREPPRPVGPSERAEAQPLPRRELISAIATMAIIRFASNAPQPILPLFIQELARSSSGVATTVGLVLAATGFASAISALALGRVADRLGARTTLMACLALATAISPLHALVGTVWQLLIVRTAMGFALGGMIPAVQALLTDRTPPSRRGAAFGLLSTAQAIGNGGGPVSGSLIAAAFGVPAVFLAAAPVFLIGAWLVARLPGRGAAAA
jgi:DHA1 family multidrug resistance protein-like MFS transporter